MQIMFTQAVAILAKIRASFGFVAIVLIAITCQNALAATDQCEVRSTQAYCQTVAAPHKY